jgi:GNAT superfamily N-acetyltransferase
MGSGRRAGGVRVWTARPAELDAVARLIGEFRDFWGKRDPATAAIRESAERIQAGGDGEYLLGAVGHDEPSGVAQLRFRWSVWTSAEDCWLEDLFVREDVRGAGLGRALVEGCFERARERGCRRIELDVNEDNRAATALYEACGFTLEPKGPGRTLFLGRGLDD